MRSEGRDDFRERLLANLRATGEETSAGCETAGLSEDHKADQCQVPLTQRRSRVTDRLSKPAANPLEKKVVRLQKPASRLLILLHAPESLVKDADMTRAKIISQKPSLSGGPVNQWQPYLKTIMM